MEYVLKRLWRGQSEQRRAEQYPNYDFADCGGLSYANGQACGDAGCQNDYDDLQQSKKQGQLGLVSCDFGAASG